VERARFNFKAIINLTPNGRVLKQQLKHYSYITACSTVMYMDRWPEEAYKQVGLIRLNMKEQQDDDEADFDAMIGTKFEIAQPEEVVKQALRMHVDIGKGILKYIADVGIDIKLTPITFLNMLETFREIYDSRSILYT